MSTPHRSWLRVALALVLAAILSVTLYPASGEPTHPLVWCIVCGEGGTADVILNIILFLPLGGVLALLGVPRNRAWIAGTLLSGMIECAQLGIPGRDSSLGDVLSNSTGTILGFILAGWVLLRLRPQAASLAACRVVPPRSPLSALLQPNRPRTCSLREVVSA